MLTSGNISKLRRLLKNIRKKDAVIGLVPTMGALHDGHISLVRQAKKDCDYVVVTIFVNPTQFCVGEDFNKYPRTLAQDKKLLISAGADMLFIPRTTQMYHHDNSVYVDEGDLSRGLCGAVRPGHFKGVCTVVAKLFNIITPDIAYFGQKDYQQVCVIKRMVRDLDFSVSVKVCPTVREDDSLAMSSRNRYLSSQERAKAVILSRALMAGRSMINNGEVSVHKVTGAMRDIVSRCEDVKIDYLEIRTADNLQELSRISGNVVLLGAVKIGSTRLIDNILVKARKG